MSKITSRESVFKLVYEYIFQQELNITSMDYFLNEEKESENIDYIRSSYVGIIENYDNIINIIRTHLDRYKIEQLSKIDLAIIIPAVYQLSILHNQNIKIEINEAVELAKKYSADNSYKFVNGVLAKIVKQEGLNGE